MSEGIVVEIGGVVVMLYAGTPRELFVGRTGMGDGDQAQHGSLKHQAMKMKMKVKLKKKMIR